MVKIIRLTEQDLYRIVKRVLNESIKDNLPSNKALEKLEKDYSVKIEDSHIESEREQEGVDYYEDNGGVDSKSKEQLKKLLSALYLQFKNAPKDKNSNCDNIPGCISGYRGYMTQANVFGNKMKSRKQSVSQRQKVSALPGFSQHHTGKTFDILSVEDSFWDSNPEIKKWVEDNVSKYGFKISYPSNGSLRNAEPWHIYYVGGEVSDEELKKEKNEKIEKKVDDFYASDKENPEVEKKIEKRYEIVGCSPKREYTESPNFDKIKSDSSVVIRIGHKGSPVEEIQKKLVDLGYNIGSCGVDGLFGPRTKKGLEDYQEENDLDVSSAVNQETLESLEKPISKQKKSSSESKRVTEISKNDKEFYGNILKGIGAPITEENLKFFYAWRAAEGGKAKNNPFNTTQGIKDDPGISVYGKNKAGVKNYSTSEFGIKATIKTLLNGRYPCIVDGLKNDIGAEKISECFDNLETWGTGELVDNVIYSGSIRYVPINTDYESEKPTTQGKGEPELGGNETSKSTTDSEFYVVIPNGYTGGEAHVLFGGAHSNTGGEVNSDYLKRFGDMVAKYVKNKIIISTHHKNTLNSVKEYAKQKLGANVTSIAGFSQGGKETWKHKDDTSLRIVGLIDPSTYEIDLSLGANTYLYANPKNWDTTGFKGDARKRLQWYCDHKNDNKYKGHVFCPSVSHVGMMDEFYSNYASKI
jgi:LAS superfamily LD-carboxypeptidase LdcB/peptidoglycan hydrolase-like protein with peptidoglycan-binding domain